MDWEEVGGIVEDFHEPVLDGGCPIQVAVAILKPDKWGMRRVVSGRGVTRREAATRCLSEAVERQAAIYEDGLSIIKGNPADLGAAAIDPQSLLLISDRQYAQAPEWNGRVDAIHRFPARLERSRDITWIRARSLIDESVKLVPAASCFLGYPHAIEEGFPVPDSNGLASGDSLADAIERALLEVIERDAVSIWWYGRAHRPAMDLDGEKLPLWLPFGEWMRRCDRRFWILDLTHDLGVPVTAAISSNMGGGDLSFGFAAARTREAAAQAAMGELVQFELTKTLQSRSHGKSPIGFLAWCISAKLDDHRFILPSKTACPQQIATSVDSAVSTGFIKEKKFEVCVVDFTPHSQNAKVVRVLAPGLRPIWPRFAPGRLYDVPYGLGWHGYRLNETELNPIHILY